MYQCTQKEFENTVFKHKPAKWFDTDYHPVSGILTVFALDTFGETQLPYTDKWRIANYMWFDGEVMVDTPSIFPQGSQSQVVMGANGTLILTGMPICSGPVSVTIDSGQPSNLLDLYYQSTKLKTPNSIKCECGAHAVGATQHSNWCQMKEIS